MLIGISLFRETASYALDGIIAASVSRGLRPAENCLMRRRTRRAVSGLVSQIGDRIRKISGVETASTRWSPIIGYAYCFSVLSHC